MTRNLFQPARLAAVILILTLIPFGTEAAPRVVSLSPALTELIWQLGGGKMQVGRSAVCNFPEEAKKLPVAGNFAGPSLEKLLRLKTEILLVDCLQDPRSREVLERAGIRVEVLPLRNLAEYRSAVAATGRLLGREAEAKEELARLDDYLALCAKRGAAERKRKPRVLFLVWDQPMTAAGGRSHLSEYVRLAGGELLGDAVEREYFRCAREWVLKEGPEVIFLPTGMGRETKPRLEGFESVPAVKNGNVYGDGNPDVYFRLGPRYREAVEGIREKLSESGLQTAESVLD